MKRIRRHAKTLQVTILTIGSLALVVLLPQWRSELQALGYCPGDATVTLNENFTHEEDGKTCASFTALSACSGALSTLTSACNLYCRGPTGSGMCVGQTLTQQNFVDFQCEDFTRTITATMGIPPLTVEVGESYPVASITCGSGTSTDCHCLPASEVTFTNDPRTGAASKRK
jgi:hypothetical protein